MNSNQKEIGLLPIESRKQSDKAIDYFLISFYLIGIILSLFYDTWIIGIGVGTLSLLAYYSAKLLLPNSNFYQYVLSVVFGFFMAQYIYQMHGLFEMHFMAFVGSTMLVTYKNWKLQIPLAIVVGVHHLSFNYLQYIGYKEIYFTQLPYLDIQTLIIHGILATLIFGICGLWAYQIKKYNEQIEASNRDIAEKRQELLEINYELERSNYDLMQFASVASHDLKEPLRKIQSYTDLITSRHKESLDNNTEKYFGYIKGAAGRMKMLIDDILQYSKLSGGPQEYKNVDLNDLITDILNDLEIIIREKNAVIEVGPLFRFNCVAGQMRQVFQNLITNALKFQKSGVSPIIKIFEQNPENQVRFRTIHIEDNGIGFDMEYSDKIFTLFNRLNSKDKYEGTGIGLSIVKKIAERHGGDIVAKSEPGKGSVFILFLPVSVMQGNKSY